MNIRTVLAYAVTLAGIVDFAIFTTGLVLLALGLVLPIADSIEMQVQGGGIVILSIILSAPLIWLSNLSDPR